MAREVSFVCPFEVPRTNRSRWEFKRYLEALIPQIGVWGKDGKDVGYGFIWETHTGLPNRGLVSVAIRIRRALFSSGIFSARAEPYHLTQRLVFLHDGEPKVTITLKED